MATDFPKKLQIFLLIGNSYAQWFFWLFELPLIRITFYFPWAFEQASTYCNVLRPQHHTASCVKKTKASCRLALFNIMSSKRKILWIAKSIYSNYHLNSETYLSYILLTKKYLIFLNIEDLFHLFFVLSHRTYCCH